MPKGTDQRYIVKVISVPASQTQLDALLLTGAYPDEEAALKYFSSVAEDIQAEVEILAGLSKTEGFVPFEGCQIVPMEDAVGYDVYLLAPYKRSVARFFQKETMTHLKAINLGLDMCAALALSRQAGYLYVDLKPENVYVGPDGEYRIGDLGFVKLDSIKYASLPDKYRSAYTAPELQDVYATVNETVDIYAAGLILYQAYNGGVLPAELSKPGQALPAPIFADYEMSEIILKACDPDPAQRWANPVLMGQALISYMQRNGANDTPIVPAAAAAEPAQDLQLTAELEGIAAILGDAPAEEAQAEAELSEEAQAEAELSEEVPEQAVIPAIHEDDNGQICMAAFTQEDTEENVQEEAEQEETAREETDNAPPVLPVEDEHRETKAEALPDLDKLLNEETVPAEEIPQEATYEALSPEINDILSQADALIAHEPPEPAVAPEAVPIVLPEPDAGDEALPAETPMDAPADAPMDAPGDAAEDSDENTAAVAVEVAAERSEAMEESEAATEAAADPELQEPAAEAEEAYELEEDTPAFNGKKLLAILIAAVLLAGLLFGGYIFYREYYLQSVTSLTLDGSEDTLTVKVDTAVDESLLSIVCVDTYGTKQVQPVQNGMATFTGLNPSTLYSIRVEISGLHKLHGEISDSYSTPMHSAIISLNAVTGSESGSAIISFAVDGSDSKNWTLTYSSDAEGEKTHSFSGHMATVTGLTLGQTYRFTLASADGAYLTGETEVRYTAIAPVYAEALKVSGNGENGISVTWEAPEDTLVESWIVHCYSGEDFNKTLTVTETAAAFDDLDFSKAHTIEVTAAGMSAGTRFYMSENAVSVSDVTASVTAQDTITVDWNCASSVSGQWFVQYTIDEMPDQQPQIVRTGETKAVIRPIIPNATYRIEIKLENGSTVLASPMTVKAEAKAFQGHILGYLVKDTPIQFSMCKRPSFNGWSYANVQAYTSTFEADDLVGFVGYIPGKYNSLANTISVQYVYRDADGNIVGYQALSAVWRNMWYRRYCALDAPALPQEAGSYTVEIYFDGYLAHQQSFTVN